VILWSLALTLSTAGPFSIRFEDRTAASGIEWQHQTGGSGRRYIVETFGGGAIVLDYDIDGLPDLLFINGGPLPGHAGPRPRHALYRNRGDGTFDEVTEAAGITAPEYGMGGAAADLDNDGDVDLYLTGFGPDVLYRNNGDGSFTDATADSGLGDPGWSTSAAWVDLDGDGFLDLYVARYLDFTMENHKRCTSGTKGIEAFCHPQEYDGVLDLLYRNLGDGRMAAVDLATAHGRDDGRGKGLGVVAGDFDRDGDPDLHVANDTTRNFLYRNDGDGRLVEIGLVAGVGYNEEGLPEAGMGTDWGDFDRNGLLDLVVTNFDFERNTVYRNLGGGLFMDYTSAVGLGHLSLTELGFGCDWADFDNDGWVDLVVTNGHILDNIAEIQTNLSHTEPAQLFHNVRGKLQDRSDSVGSALRRPRVGRGLATLDYDGDGDLDLALANNGGPAELLSNQGGNRSGWVALDLIGVRSNRGGVGARLEAELEGLPWVEEVRAGSSYLSQNELAVFVGLGESLEVDLTVQWPSGASEELKGLAARRRYWVKEGSGVLGAR
jgi:hypothetical protein